MKKLVIIPGGYHPYHAGHKALYDAAVAAFPSADVFVAATADTSSRPFPFAAKKFLAQQAGVPGNRFIQVKSPFRAEEITQMYDPDTTQLIFVRSEKDQMKQPQAGGVKKDGSASYLQPYKRNGLEPFSKHGYMAYLPTVQFGPGMTSATEIRAKWPGMTPEEKIDLVRVLYPSTQTKDAAAGKIVGMLDQVLGPTVSEASGNGSLMGTPIGSAAQRLNPASTGMPNGPDQEPKANRPGFTEATLVNNPETGIEIRPSGGLGTWTEDTLKSSLARQLMQVAEALKSGNYKGAEYLLYKGGVIQSKVQALARLEDFNQRQGRRPIAKGREIDIGETTDYLDES